MTTRSYIAMPSRLLNYVLTGDASGLDPKDRDTCDRWFNPAVLGVIVDVEPGPPLTRYDEPFVCLVCDME